MQPKNASSLPYLLSGLQGLILCPSKTGTTSKEITSNTTRSANWTMEGTTSPQGPSSRRSNSLFSTTRVSLQHFSAASVFVFFPSLSFFLDFLSQGSRAVLPPDRALPQRHASPDRPVRQNQRRVGDTAGVAAAH